MLEKSMRFELIIPSFKSEIKRQMKVRRRGSRFLPAGSGSMIILLSHKQLQTLKTLKFQRTMAMNLLTICGFATGLLIVQNFARRLQSIYNQKPICSHKREQRPLLSLVSGTVDLSAVAVYLKYLSSMPFSALPCLASSQAISWTVALRNLRFLKSLGALELILSSKLENSS